MDAGNTNVGDLYSGKTILITGGTPVPRAFRCASDTNEQWLSALDLAELVGRMAEEEAMAIGGRA